MEIIHTMHSQKANILLYNDSEKGFLDFMAGIEENMDEMTSYIEQMTNDMLDMTDGVSESTEKINSVTGNGGASFVRKEVSKSLEISTK